MGSMTEFEFEDIVIQTPEQKPRDTTWKKTSVQSKFLHHLKPARDSKPSRRASKALEVRVPPSATQWCNQEPGRRLGPSPEGHRILQPRSETYGMPGPGVRGGTEEADHLLRVRVVSVGYAVVRVTSAGHAVVRPITKDKTEEPVLSQFSFETQDVSMPWMRSDEVFSKALAEVIDEAVEDDIEVVIQEPKM
ncbi:hypothetical protein V8E54_002968 [Elaphomyces granulatus]